MKNFLIDVKLTFFFKKKTSNIKIVFYLNWQILTYFQKKKWNIANEIKVNFGLFSLFYVVFRGQIGLMVHVTDKMSTNIFLSDEYIHFYVHFN